MQIPSLPHVTHQYSKVNGVRLHIAEVGKGKPLFLIHGWPQHWYVWRELIPLLADKYRLIMPDLPGFGWSDPAKNNDYRKEQLADMLIALLDVLKLKHVGLIGHDWGGWIGFLMCLKAPQRFTNYIALGIGHPFESLQLSIWDYRRFLYQLPLATPFLGEQILRLAPSLLELSIKHCVYKTNRKSVWTKKDLTFFSKVLQDPQKAHASSLLYRTFLMKELTLLQKYKNQKLNVPTHLLIGDSDPIIHPSLFRDFKNPTNNLTIEIVKKCGHFIPEEQPDLVAKKIKLLFNS